MTTKRDDWGNPSRWSTLFSLFMAVGLIVALFGMSIAAVAEPTRIAGKGDIAVKLSLLITNGKITVGEPLIAKVEIINNTSEKLDVLSGNGSASTTFFEVRDKSGKVLAATPLPSSMRTLDYLQGLDTLRPNRSYSHYWVISALYNFSRMGEYRVVVKQLGNNDEVLAEASAPLRVTRIDVKKLEARIQEISETLLSHKASSNVPQDMGPGIIAQAVYSVRHDTALPYLKRMAIEWNDSNAVVAMRRIGSDKAQQIIQELLESPNEKLAKAAQNAMQKPLEPRSIAWEMGD